MNTLNRINTHPRFSNSLDKHQIQFLDENIDFFLDFVENYDTGGGINAEESEDELEAQIASVAHEAEDIIESHIVNQILPGSAETIWDARLHHRCLFGLQKVINDMDFIKVKVLKVKEKRDKTYQKPPNPIPADSTSPTITTGKSSSMVGFDDELYQLKDVLTGQQSSLQIISIVGMGGAGKTTLAKNVYEDSVIMHHFDLRAWATISQDYNVRDVLLQLLSLTTGTVAELTERLHKRLFDRRYLIILDDMWSVDVWDSIKFYFPDSGDGSRVVLTTRLSNVATQLGSICTRINFLDEHKSWILFCQEVFGQEDCPLDLVGIGKEIVKQCKGLPLSIVVIGGLLRKSHRAVQYWHNIANNVRSVLNSSENGQCLDVLYLSYCHLPAHLKPCFLYTGICPEDSVIRVSLIINLWVAEGILKPNGMQMLEEIAEDYLKDLIDRNLILVDSYCSNGKIKSCCVHDLIRDLCLMVSNKEKLFLEVCWKILPQRMDVVHSLMNQDLEALQSASHARSRILSRCWFEIPVKSCGLWRVETSYRSLEDEFQKANLRYIAVSQPVWSRFLHPSISLFWNLQTLVIRESSVLIKDAPLEIWKMTQLRHLDCDDIILPDPSPSDEDNDSVVLRNLQTLKKVTKFRLSEEACKRIPNIKKLYIRYGTVLGGYGGELHGDLQNVGLLKKIESLSIQCHTRISANLMMKAFHQLISLSKLCLGGDNITWEELSIMTDSLPQLQVLKLVNRRFSEGKWSCAEGGFLRLKYLQIKYGGLDSWCLESASCFPVLEKLNLLYVSRLNEIPSEFGEIPTLQLIRLVSCCESVVISAMKIKDKQDSFGNDGLLIQVDS